MNNGLIRTILAIVTLLSSSLSTAQADGDNLPAIPDNCGCLWQGSFSEVAGNTDLVALGEVTRVRGNAVDIALERTLLGNEWRQELRVWMKARDYCRPDADQFPPGSRWVMAINKIDAVPEGGFDPLTPNISYGRQHDYILSSCGGYFLKANGNTVQGNLIPDMPRWAHAPDMTPVLIDLVARYLSGAIPLDALVTASEEDPAARELMLDTRSFLRGQDRWLDDASTNRN